MGIFLFILTLFSVSLAYGETGPLEPTNFCSTGYIGLGRQSLTDPREYFSEKRVKDRPRMVVMVGIPGSGKSTWAREAARQGWAVISSDRVRREILGEMRARGETIGVKGKQELADPDNVDHFFRLETDAFVSRQIQEIKEASARSQPIVLDNLNLSTAHRVLYLLSLIVWIAFKLRTGRIAQIRLGTRLLVRSKACETGHLSLRSNRAPSISYLQAQTAAQPCHCAGGSPLICSLQLAAFPGGHTTTQWSPEPLRYPLGQVVSHRENKRGSLPPPGGCNSD